MQPLPLSGSSIGTRYLYLLTQGDGLHARCLSLVQAFIRRYPGGPSAPSKREDQLHQPPATLMSDFLSSQGRCGTMRHCFFLVACLAWASGSVSAEPQVPRGKLTPVQRMAPLRLKAAHEDVERIHRSRRAMPRRPGLNDYRAILHAHAEDSSHTGGTRPEMLAEAKRAGVDAILLTDHHRPPRDFMTDSWRGLRDGVLFVPGSEERGFLLYPARSIMDRMNDPTPPFIEAVRADGGLIFLSHIEERPDHSMEGLDGMEIYNRHADAKKDTAGLLAIMLKLTDSVVAPEFEDIAAGLSRRALRRPGGISGRLPRQVGRGDRRRAGSPAWPPTTAITTWSCS